MFKNFSEHHPWLSKKIKKQVWNLLNIAGIDSYIFQLNNSMLKFNVNPKDDSVGKFIFLNSYETETLLFASKYIVAGDQVIDIGANIGYFTLLFSSYVGENGEVHSFEPSRREFLHLCKNVNLNHAKNIFLSQFGLSNQDGYAIMNVLDDDRFGAYNSLGEITHQKVNLATTHTETIRTMKIDSYLSLFPRLKPCLIKIDVEGFEKQVLEGMQILLSSPKAPCLIIEVCESTHRDKKIATQELVNYIQEFGYRLYNLDRKGNLIPFQLETSLNCIAIKPSHSQRLFDQGIKPV